ncbi:MAG: DEAD/DEAH box helicase [Phenylobacterium zucineum]|nr:MAG: DEAD/DEAH box helicase [Phenylobacterium zucineum]
MRRETISIDLDAAHTDARLEATGGTRARAPTTVASQPPPAWVALHLLREARTGRADTVFVASSERRAEEIGRALRRFGPDLDVLVLPAWDCLPFDRASPSRDVMGRRMAVLAALARPADRPRILISPVEALLQRTPPRRVLNDAFLELETGRRIERERLADFARRTGYVVDDRIDEPGEIAVLGEVVDIYPPGADAPVRVVFGPDEEIAELRVFDPLTQRSEGRVEAVRLSPASELIGDGPDVVRTPGCEHQAQAVYGRMDTVLAQVPEAAVWEDPKAARRARDFLGQVQDALEARRHLAVAPAAPDLSPKLYQTGDGLRRQLRARGAHVLRAPPALHLVPNFALDRNPGGAFCGFVKARLDAGRTVVLAGLRHELRPMLRAIRRGLDLAASPAAAWAEVEQAPAGGLFAFEADLDAGFEAAGGLVLIAASNVLGGRMAAPTTMGPSALTPEPDLRGDVVLHEDHGLGVLETLETVEVEGRPMDALRIAYHGGAHLLAGVDELPRIWRYGAEPEAVTLDRLHTDAWRQKRAALSGEIDQTAARLVAEAQARRRASARPIRPRRAAMARFAARFAYPETADQTAAIAAILDDLASGRVMNRLVCGDVGFGKTEVALRAAAAAALSGRQVALVAPTTVLARQHLETFRRRFEGTGVEIGMVSRLTRPAEAKALREGVARGDVGVVIGTHALAGQEIAFADLALVIVDEEQRFGAALKARLAALAPDAHRLTLTATPIPRTLQSALVGLQDVSLLTSPPARRRPVRTFLAPHDPATVRTALLREQRRGGQSFVVVPRIEDIAPAQAALAQAAPELAVRVAHGGLAPEAIDTEMVAFAGGDGDVLLATSIIESGLDVPRANTMIVSGAERFGLAQLHQLRGRVGRGRTQGVAYLFTSGEAMADVTRARLSTLLAHDRLGAGLAIALRDLDLRGGGALLGEEQSGHVSLIGAALYQRLLARAVAVAKGETPAAETPAELNIGPAGAIPPSYVPEAAIRVNLYARLFRAAEIEAIESLADEIEDRFGAPPSDVLALLDGMRLRILCAAAGVARVDAGPKAVAFTFAPGRAPPLQAGLERRGGRWIWRDPPPPERLQAALETLLVRWA